MTKLMHPREVHHLGIPKLVWYRPGASGIIVICALQVRGLTSFFSENTYNLKKNETLDGLKTRNMEPLGAKQKLSAWPML